MRKLRRFRAAATTLVGVGCITGCARFAGGLGEAFTSDEELAKKGAETHKEVLEQLPVYAHGDLDDYVDRVGQRVARAADPTGKTYHFYVLDTEDPNAFAIPGGYVYITRGMLALLDSEDELAVTLGHEIGHLVARHSAARARAHGGSSIVGPLIQAGSVVAAVLTLNPLLLVGVLAGSETSTNLFADVMTATYGRSQEIEADQLGMSYAARAGYRPAAALRVITSFQQQAALDARWLQAQGLKVQERHGIFVDHPDNEARLAAARTFSAQLRPVPAAPTGDFLGELDGVRYGQTHFVGVLRQNAFYDGDDRLVMNVPAGWFTLQADDGRLVIFNAPRSAAQIAFARQDLPDEMSATVFVKTYVSGAKLEGGPKSVAGHRAWVGTGVVGERHYRIIGWTESVDNKDYGYLFTGQLTTDDAEGRKTMVAWPQTFDAFEKALRPMKAKESALAEAPVLHTTTATTGKKYADYARNAPLGPIAEAELRLLNAQPAPVEPQAGQRLKLVD